MRRFGHLQTRRTFLAGFGPLVAGLATSAYPLPVFAQIRPVSVGAILPLSGPLKLYGEQAKLGVDLAMLEINKAGGILGRPLKVIYYDNETKAETSERGAVKFTKSDDILAIIGPMSSRNRDIITPFTNDRRVPLLYATNYEGGACSPYTFVFGTVPNQVLTKLISYLAGTVGQSFYMFGANYIWPENMFKIAEPLIRLNQGQTLGKEFTPFGAKGYRSVIRRIRDSGAKILLFALPGPDAVNFINEAEESGLLNSVTIAFLAFNETYLSILNPHSSEGIYCVVPMIMSSSQPAVRDFVARVQNNSRAGQIVSGYALTHYNALRALWLGVTRRGEVSREALVDGMEGLQFDSPTGPVRINAQDHHASMTLYMGRTEAGNLREIASWGSVEPAVQCM